MPDRAARRVRLVLPRAERTPPRWYAVALGVEAALIAALIAFRVNPDEAPPAPAAYLLDLPAAPSGEAAPPRGALPRERRLPPLAVEPSVVPINRPTAGRGGPAPGPLTADTGFGASGGAPRTLAGLGPRDGDGRLWARPRVDVEWSMDNRPINLDSVVRQRLLAMADSIERHPTVDPGRPARWTFERNGQTYGMDEHGNIRLGPITIPGAVLALIPMPQGNIDQARANARLAAMRADIMRAAARAEAEDDFRRAVQMIRERNDRERRERRERERREAERAIP